MPLQTIKVSQAYESATNPRGKDFEGPAFDDLVASIKEKGVLVPVIARRKPKAGKEFEVVAGNRRLRAAKIAGLEDIPASVKEMDDEQAREVQIIENLQREGVHPLEEAEAYRQLIEKSKLSIEDIARRVGKSESYVRYRLFLTNLIEKAANAFRKGKITDGHAVLIAKLSPKDQADALQQCMSYNELPTVKELKDWIQKAIYKPLSYQPWLDSKEANEAAGPCKECPPNKSSLFGDVKEGACTDLRCWNRKMKLFVNYVAEKENTLLKVGKEYGTPENKGVLSRSEYQPLSTKVKTHCEHAEKAVVAEGPDQGSVIWICADKKCEKHGEKHAEYSLSPKEKERRKIERQKELKKKEKESEALMATLDKIEWPLGDKELNVLLEMAVGRAGTMILRPVAKRHDIKAKEVKNSWGKSLDYGDPIREAVNAMSDRSKFRLVVELMLEPLYGDLKKKIIKLLD